MAVFLPASSFMFYTPMELCFVNQSAHSKMQKVQNRTLQIQNEQKVSFLLKQQQN
jgi:hypothetical protein